MNITRPAPLRILLVEDSPSDAELIMLQIEQDGLAAEYKRVENESDYTAALAWTPELILSDYSLPRLNGLRALRILKEQNLDIPFILISGNIGEDIAVNAMKSGADDYLMKDRPARLGTAIRHALEQKYLREEKKQTEKTLRLNEERFKNLLETAPDAIVISQADGRIVQVNAQVEKLFDYQDDELIGKQAEILIPERLRGRRSLFHAEHIKEAPEQDTGNMGAELSGRRKDGSEFPIEIKLGSLETPDGTLFTAIIRDITERKWAEEALLASRSQLRSVLKTIPDCVVQAGTDGIVQFVNRSDSNQIIGTSILEWMQPEYRPAFQSMLTKVLTTGKYDEIETVDIVEDGSQKWFLNRIGPMVEDDHVVALTIVRQDITSRKQAENQIKRQVEYLKALNMIDSTITASTDIHLTLQTIINHASAKLQVDAADILLLNPATHALEYSYGTGFRSADIKQSFVRVNSGGAGEAVWNRKTVIVHDLAIEGTKFQRHSMIKKEGFVFYVGVPFMVKGEVRGVLEVFHRKPLLPDQEWVDFLKALAGQAALALDNATMFRNLQQSNIELSMAYETTLEGWSAALDLRDKETEGHTKRVTDLTLRLARFLGFREKDLIHIRRGALLHDIGKMGIPDKILLKQDRLTDEEWQTMRRHPEHAYTMLSGIEYLRPALVIPYCHHEKWDGTGYPRGLKGEEIPPEARLFAVVDVYDALTSDRPYRPAWSHEETIEYIKKQSGIQFDPRVVEGFLSLIEEDSKQVK